MTRAGDARGAGLELDEAGSEESKIQSQIIRLAYYCGRRQRAGGARGRRVQPRIRGARLGCGVSACVGSTRASYMSYCPTLSDGSCTAALDRPSRSIVGTVADGTVASVFGLAAIVPRVD